MRLNEGGNAIKASAPIRGDIAKIIADSIVKKIQNGLQVEACALGSTGKKSAAQMSGDIDIAVELQWNDENVQKVKAFIPKAFGKNTEVVDSPGLKLISMGFPYKFGGIQNIAQVDLMFTTDINYSKFMYHSPNFIKNESLFKGLYRTNLLIIIAGKTPIDIEKYKNEYFTADEFGVEYEGELKSFWKYSLSYDEGLKIVHKSFEGKRKPLKAAKTIKEDTILITRDLPTILKMCLGEKATVANCNSFETLVDFICSPDYIHRTKERLNNIFEDFFEDPRHTKDEEILKLLHTIVNDAYEKYGVNQLNESQWDFRHIDPVTGMPKMKPHRKEDDIKLMNQYPGKTGWIILLQNRVNLNSVGNIRYKKRMWYDRMSRTVSSDRDMSDAVLISRYVLPHAGRPAGWMYANELDESVEVEDQRDLVTVLFDNCIAIAHEKNIDSVDLEQDMITVEISMPDYENGGGRQVDEYNEYVQVSRADFDSYDDITFITDDDYYFSINDIVNQDDRIELLNGIMNNI